MTTRNVAVLVGSLRKQSFNRKIANEMIALAPASLNLEIVEIGQLSFFNQDLEATPPADWVEFRARVAKADAALFVTPEFNRSVPGVLKNALDVGSRPYGKSAWNGKPAAVASVSMRDRRLRRQSSSATITHICEHANTAAAGSVHQQRFRPVR
jgi:chromate reductase, NAD(P)H dehydrogenase (quinone)